MDEFKNNAVFRNQFYKDDMKVLENDATYKRKRSEATKLAHLATAVWDMYDKNPVLKTEYTAYYNEKIMPAITEDLHADDRSDVDE